MIELLALSAVLFGGLALAAWIADRGMDASVKQLPRPDRRIAPDEMELVGDDWRDHVRHLFPGVKS